MKVRRPGFIFLIMLISTGLKAQVNFHTSVYPEVIHKDELVTFRMVIENSKELQHISPPAFNDFVLMSGPNEESGYVRINGSMTHYLALSFILKPKRSGTIKIGRSEIKVAGKTLKSEPVKLMVKNSVSGSSLSSQLPGNPPQKRSAFNASDYILKKGDNVTEKVKRNMRLKLQLDKRKCYVGEPVVACYKLYSRLKSDSRLVQNPSFNGFSVVDLQAPDVTAFENEKIDGRDYNAYTIRKAQLYPLQAGIIQVEPAELENNVLFLNEHSPYASQEDLVSNFDALGSGGFITAGDVTNAMVNLTSTPEEIEVRPLPEKDKPLSFKGAVGEFKIHSEINENRFTVNKSGILSVTVSGKGNLQLITPPDIRWPEFLESFEPKTVDNLQMNTIPVSGKRKYEYVFSATRPGEYTLPSIEFSYFDPEKEIYKTVKTDPIKISVLPAEKTEVKVVSPQKIKNNNQPVERNLIVGIVVAMMLTGVGLYAFLSRRKQPSQPDETIAEEKPNVIHYSNEHNPLEASGKYLNSDSSSLFYSKIHSDIRNFFADKTGIPPNEVNARSIDLFIEKKNMPNEYSVEFQNLLREIEWQLFAAGGNKEEMQATYNKAQALIQSINMYCVNSQ